MNKSDTYGFTLMELMIVIVIIGILAAFMIPNLRGWQAKKDMDYATRILYNDIQKARYEAIRKNETVKFCFDTASTPNRYIAVASASGTVIRWTNTSKSTITLSPSFGTDASTANSTGFSPSGLALKSGSVTVTNSDAPIDDRIRTITLTIGGSTTITP